MRRRGESGSEFLRRRARLRPWVAVGLAVAGIAATGAVVDASVDPLFRAQIYANAGGLVARALELGLSLYDPFAPPDPSPICNCSTSWDYRCDDPESEYFRRVRSDPRVAPILGDRPRSLEDVASMQDFLRDLFPHHTPLNPSGTPFDQYNLLQRLDDASAGSGFLCGGTSKMLMQLVQAAGGFARLVSLSDAQGSGHVVTEVWVEDERKWVVFDPDFNVYFTDASGAPLNAVELHAIERSGEYDRAIAHRGRSPNSQYEPGVHAELLRHYDSLAFNRRADFVGTTYPRFHPARHAARTFSGWDDRSVFAWLAVRDWTDDPSEIYFEPCRPSSSAGADSGAPSPER